MQIMLVHTITEFYYSNPSCYRKMQGDAKLHHPPEWDVQRLPPNRGIILHYPSLNTYPGSSGVKAFSMFTGHNRS